MKILYITCNNSFGGSNVALLNILWSMKNKGHEMLVITLPGSGPLLEKLDEWGIAYKQMRLRHNIYPKSHNPILYLPRLFWMLYVNWAAYYKIKKIAQDFKPDIIHTNVGSMSVGYDVAKKLGISHIWHHREYQDLDFNYHFFPSIRTFLKKTHSTGNNNISITEGIFNYRHFRRDVDKVIYDGVFSQKVIRDISQEKKENYILYAGRIEEAKGTLNLIQAYTEFHKDYPNISLKIAGTFHEKDTYYQSCIQEIDKSGLFNSIEFLGERNDIYVLMSHALMLVVPSRSEGFGFITAEAMLNGCPVIGRNTAGTKEQFDKGLEYTGQEIGLRFHTQEELIHCMKRVMKEDLTEMCQRAHKTVMHYYTVERNVQEIEDFYKDILKGRKRNTITQ